MAKASKYTSFASDKKKGTAFLLCLVFGIFGGHQFYVRKYGTGLLYFCTFGMFLKCWRIDMWQILGGVFEDSDGMPLRR